MNRPRCNPQPVTVVVVAQPTPEKATAAPIEPKSGYQIYERPIKKANHNYKIYQRAYQSYLKFKAAGIVDPGDRRELMIMLVAADVGFDRDKVVSESKQPRDLVNKVFDNMEENGLWANGKWYFEHDIRSKEVDEWQCAQVEIALHIMCATGEVVRVNNESERGTECNGGSYRRTDPASQGDTARAGVGCEERPGDTGEAGSSSEQSRGEDSADGAGEDSGSPTPAEGPGRD